ncbi:hypothetical protein, partial [Nocardioides sp.]|uniref:hypothetical protein n=1 Tax=Nocardioides sp. TaxID=35761 RepID=UPI0025DB3BC1
MTQTTDGRAEAGRPRWWVAGLSLFLLVASGLVAWQLTDDDVYVAPPPSAPAHSVSPGLAAQTLTRFQKAVRAGDLEAARALAPADDPAAAELLAAVVRNAEALRVDDFTLRYVDAEGALGVDGDWNAAVDATWRFAGFDRAPARAEIMVELREEGERVALTGFGGGDRVSPLWLSGPLQVRRTARTLVLVDGSP